MIIVRNENFKEFISRYPVTTVIVVINLLIFLYTTLLGGLTNPKVLYDLGGISLEYIQKGEYYRLISSAFIHDGFLHFIVNMGLILLTAPPIESLLGKKWFLLLFFVSVLGASIFNVFWSGDVAVGASGFGYGILGVYLPLIILRSEVIDKESGIIILLIISVGWILTFVYENISFLGHLGGFVSGIVFGLIFMFTKFSK